MDNYTLGLIVLYTLAGLSLFIAIFGGVKEPHKSTPRR